MIVTIPAGQSNGSAAGGGGDKVFQFQPVIQPPNTATVVFNSDNLGELEILNNNKQGRTLTIDIYLSKSPLVWANPGYVEG